MWRPEFVSRSVIFYNWWYTLCGDKTIYSPFVAWLSLGKKRKDGNKHCIVSSPFFSTFRKVLSMDCFNEITMQPSNNSGNLHPYGRKRGRASHLTLSQRAHVWMDSETRFSPFTQHFLVKILRRNLYWFTLQDLQFVPVLVKLLSKTNTNQM